MTIETRILIASFFVALLIGALGCVPWQKQSVLVWSVDQQMSEISSAYRKEAWEPRAKRAARLIGTLRQAPTSDLEWLSLEIKARIQKDGILPFVDVLLEYAQRIANTPGENSNEVFELLSMEIAKTPIEFPDDMGWPVLVRDLTSDGYRLISANLAVAALLLTYTDDGYEHLAAGNSPMLFARVAVLANMCRSSERVRTFHLAMTNLDDLLWVSEDDDGRETVALKEKYKTRLREEVEDPCDLLLDRFGLGETEPQPSPSPRAVALGTALDNLSFGVTLGARQCIGSLVDDSMQNMVGQVDQILSCKTHASGRWGSPEFDPRSSLMIGSQLGYHWGTAIHRALKNSGYFETGGYSGFITDSDFGVDIPPEIIGTTVINPGQDDGMLFVTSEYEHANGNTVNVSTENWSDGRTVTTITQVSPAGTTTHRYEGSSPGQQRLESTTFRSSSSGEYYGTSYQYNNNNQMSGMTVNGPNGSVNYTVNPQTNQISGASWSGSDGSSYNATYNSNGTLSSETITDCSGNTCDTTTVDYDDNGDCVSNCDTSSVGASDEGSASTPVGEDSPESRCVQNALGFSEEAFRNPGTFDPLAPYIYPHPDDASGSIPNACLDNFSNSQVENCQSVALCLYDTQSPGTCGCGSSRSDLPIVGAGQGACNQMMCADGASCDPNTGTCRVPGDGTFEPGVIILPIGDPPSLEIPTFKRGKLDIIGDAYWDASKPPIQPNWDGSRSPVEP